MSDRSDEIRGSILLVLGVIGGLALPIAGIWAAISQNQAREDARREFMADCLRHREKFECIAMYDRRAAP